MLYFPRVAVRKEAYHGRRGNNPVKGIETMGDKSPKAKGKQASQKQAKNDVETKKRQQEVNAKQVQKK
jgi:hypothetical protein